MSLGRLSELTSRSYHRLALLLTWALLLLRSTSTHAYYNASASQSYLRDDCCVGRPPASPCKWCGERWVRGVDRIIRYNYTLEEQFSTISPDPVTNYNCSDAQETADCIPETTSSTSEKIYLKEKVYVRDPHPTISIFPPSLSLGFIKSDNINWHGNFTNGNNTYPANQDIIWQINVPRGCRMTMAFSLFDLEPSDGCDKDYFSIQTSKNHTKSASPKYCDQLMSVEIRWRKRAQFWLHSDEENEGKGIRAAFCFSPSDREGMACSCNLQSGGKRAVRRSKSRLSKQRMEEEDNAVNAWLVEMLQKGEPLVKSYASNSSDPRRQYVAEQFQKAFEVYQNL